MDYEQKHPISQEIYEYLKNTPKEQIDKDWSYILKETNPELCYEQKYKEALERARGLLEGMDEGDYLASNGDIENIFPELKESEDDRIGNFLIDFIKICAWTDKKDQGWPSREDCIAWLEKNKRKFEESEMSITESQPQPKFQVGDKVTMKGDNTVYTIGIIAPDKTCWLKHEGCGCGWATFGILKHCAK